MVTKASDQGDFVAQYLLGLAYRDGKGVEKDNKESQLWIGYSADGIFTRSRAKDYF